MENNWQSRPEGGNRLALRATVFVARWLGRPILRLLLYPITLYFFIFRHKERAASMAYLERVFERPATRWEVFQHFKTFASVTADRIYFLTGQKNHFPVTVHRISEMQKLVDQGKGGIALAAHMGSFDAARVLGSHLGNVKLRVVLDRSIAQLMMQELEALNADMASEIIDASQPAVTLGLQIAESLGRAEWIGFLADRYRPDDRTTECDFLGDKIRLPLGPLIIAATFKVPLVCIFPLYIDGKYEIYCETLSSNFSLPRENRGAGLQECAQKYADMLSQYVRIAPYNWFNFYDYWED